MIQSWLSRVPLVFLAMAIALSPSFSFGTVGGLQKIIEIRVEDILIVILAGIWMMGILVSRKDRLEKPPLFFAIGLWLGIGFFSLLLNWIFVHVSFIRGFFFFLKEVEFFILYFYVFYHLKSLDAARSLVKLWVVLGAANVVWVVYQLVTGNRYGEYGTAALSEWGVFPTGAFFLMIFTFLFQWWLYDVLRRKIFWVWKFGVFLVPLGCIIGVFGTLSKTNFVGAFFSLFLSIFLFTLKSKKIQTALLSLGFSLVTAGIFLGLFYFFILGNLPSAERIVDILSPSGLFRSFESGRADAAIFPQLKEALQHPSIPLLGFGKGTILVYQESHNQYLRNFIETGVVGSFAFLFLLFAILKKSWEGFTKGRDGFSVGLCSGVIVATFTMLFLSLGTDAFIVVKSSEVYWFFIALTMAVLRLKNEQPMYRA